MKIAVIPARAGSKRIPRKNIRPFCGKPMMAWPIAAATASGLFDRVLVSTDDTEISAVATACGAEAPFRRPSELADDYAGTTEVVAHATKWCLDQGWQLEAVCCVYATAALVDPGDLKIGLKALEAGNWSYAFSATEYASSIFRSLSIKPDGSVEMFFPDRFAARSQDLAIAYHDAAQFYWGRPEAWLQGRRIFDRHSVAVRIPRWRVQDVDEEEDWRRAEVVFRLIRETAQA